MTEQNAALKRLRIACGILFLVGILAGCTEPAATATPAPTLTLVPVTATFTPTPVTPTPTSASLPEPEDLLTTTPVVRDAAPVLLSEITPNSRLFAAMRQDLATDLSIPAEQIQLAQLEEATWIEKPLSCEGRLFPRADEAYEGFRYWLLAGSQTYLYHADTAGNILRCGQGEPVTNALLMALDPAAAELVALAQSRVATDLDIASRRVQLLELSAHIWEDTSLGCPQPDQTYPAVAIDGYRILLLAGDAEYLFHTDSTTLFPCTPDLEQLPG